MSSVQGFPFASSWALISQAARCCAIEGPLLVVGTPKRIRPNICAVPPLVAGLKKERHLVEGLTDRLAGVGGDLLVGKRLQIYRAPDWGAWKL